MRHRLLANTALVSTCLGPLAAGCSGGGAKGVVKEYLNQKDCADRAKYILDAEKNKTLMLDYYKAKNVKQCVTEHKGVEEEDCEGKKNGEYCTVVAKGVDQRYEVKKVGDSYKVDFRGTYGVGPVTVEALKAQWNAKLDPKDTPLRVRAKLDDAYFGRYSDLKDNYLSLRLEEPGGVGKLYGYVPRASPEGAALAKLLSDGKEHRLIVFVSYHPKTRSADEIEVMKVIQEGWRQRDDE